MSANFPGARWAVGFFTRRRCLGLVCAILLAGCAAPAPTPAPTLAEQAPAAWAAPLPHDGSSAQLADWWRGTGDAALAALIDAALADNPNLAVAQARLAQARAQWEGQSAGLWPRLDAAASTQRGNTQTIGLMPGGDPPILTTRQAGVQASWEVDLFGRQSALARAAGARVQGAQALAHLARVSLTAGVAENYYALRLCQRVLHNTTEDAASRAETARLTRIAENAGFTASATAALAEAAAADARARVTQQRAGCDAQRKALVALTGLPEPDLIEKLDQSQENTGFPAIFSIATLPADTLRQRPDVWAAERDVLAARAEVDAADAARWPSLSLTGTLGKVRLITSGYQQDYTGWSFGPLQLALPLLDGGRIAAGQAAARGRYDEAVAAYKAKVRQAVQEVETALVQGAAAREKESDARATVAGYRRQFEAVRTLYQQGLANLPQLEEARRNLLAAETGLSQWRHDAQVAGVALYRAAGGGWQAPEDRGP